MILKWWACYRHHIPSIPPSQQHRAQAREFACLTHHRSLVSFHYFVDSSSLERNKQHIYIYIRIWSVGQLGLSKIRIVRILDPVPKNANLSRWGSDIRDMAAATESWRPKRTASLRLQNGQNHRPESLVKITCNYRHYIRKISKQKVLLIGQLSYKKLGCLLCLKRPDVAHFVFPHCWFLGKPWFSSWIL